MSALCEPFRRLTADRTGHGEGAGLSLSIVRSITAAHRGTVRARPGPGRPDRGDRPAVGALPRRPLTRTQSSQGTPARRESHAEQMFCAYELTNGY